MDAVGVHKQLPVAVKLATRYWPGCVVVGEQMLGE
jgi:hypothetical protein